MSRLRVIPILVVATVGCGHSTATLTGKVAYRGRPVISGSVIALAADGTARTGVIRPDGTYTVEGVPRGRVKFGVLSPDPAHARSIVKSGEADRGDQGKRSHARTPPGTGGWIPLPREAGNPESSGVECDVASSRVEFNIDVK